MCSRRSVSTRRPRYALLGDRSPEVRAQAAAWCVAVQNQVGIDHLIRLLGDVDGQCRFAAQDALIRIGLPATEALLRALGTADNDVDSTDPGDRCGPPVTIATPTAPRTYWPIPSTPTGRWPSGAGQHRDTQCGPHPGRPAP